MTKRSDTEVRWRNLVLGAKIGVLGGIVGGLSAIDLLDDRFEPEPYNPPQQHVQERIDATANNLRNFYPTLFGEEGDE